MSKSEKGTATSGVKKNGQGDPYAHGYGPREEQADTNGLMGSRSADSSQPGKEQPRASRVLKDDPDPYGVV